LLTPQAGPAFVRPDGRQWELVSPPDKHGSFIEGITFAGGTVQAAEDGSAITYVAAGPIVEDVEGNRSPEAQQVLSVRNSGGWSSQQIVPPHERAFGLHPGRPPEFRAFSPDLALSIVQPFPYGLTRFAEPPLAPPATEAERGKQDKTIY